MIRAGIFSFLFIFLSYFFFSAPVFVAADTVSDIKSQIEANNKQIEVLQTEIALFQKQLDELGIKKNTLQSTINSLVLSQKKLASEIKVTQSKIASANLKIKDLTSHISDKETTIASNRDAIAKMLKGIAEDEQTSVIIQIISSDSLRNAWQAADHAIQFNRALADNINNLRTARAELVSNRDQVSAIKSDLVALQSDLTLKKRSVDASKTAQQQLLSQTKNQEANYQLLIAEKQAAEKSFEKELMDLQNQLKMVVNSDLLPKIGSGVLLWPFSDAFMSNCAKRKNVLGNPFCITQYFGNTAFATANPQIYKGKGHNAIDIGAPIGTPIRASLGGVVLETGNTDLAHDSRGNQCWSFGKWIMIVHSNGLSTMYSHLSKIDVSKGQTVVTGQVIGLSGMTGSATGPHIHFGVYATEGTQIMTFGKFKNVSEARCASAVMPIATIDAYLNPLSYL